jgi:hypothetical protein
LAKKLKKINQISLSFSHILSPSAYSSSFEEHANAIYHKFKKNIILQHTMSHNNILAVDTYQHSALEMHTQVFRNASYH